MTGTNSLALVLDTIHADSCIQARRDHLAERMVDMAFSESIAGYVIRQAITEEHIQSVMSEIRAQRLSRLAAGMLLPYLDAVGEAESVVREVLGLPYVPSLPEFFDATVFEGNRTSRHFDAIAHIPTAALAVCVKQKTEWRLTRTSAIPACFLKRSGVSDGELAENTDYGERSVWLSPGDAIAFWNTGVYPDDMVNIVRSTYHLVRDHNGPQSDRVNVRLTIPQEIYTTA